MAWGVEELEVCERVALAVHAGVDIISGSYDNRGCKGSLPERKRRLLYPLKDIRCRKVIP